MENTNEMEASIEQSDYLKMFGFEADLQENILPLEETIAIMTERLEEFESLLTKIANDSNNVVENDVVQIKEFGPHFDDMCSNIDKMDKFVNMVNEKLKNLEETIDIAHEELDIPDYNSIKGIFKPLVEAVALGKSKYMYNSSRTNLNENGSFIKPAILDSSAHFNSE
ncbi:uncharacterized protein LOC129612050 [Condylostylus longicornis]|uniref:uncharacterized protein LOC129612050 n=1 Tax=Condylostylus longicornis TaxID=2530218 RepID=UPI00244DA71D|nr:uncharacterized protein LOC129612050 [Condylostylus longicornis]